MLSPNGLLDTSDFPTRAANARVVAFVVVRRMDLQRPRCRDRLLANVKRSKTAGGAT